jgi:alpha-ketoglutarate-dependent taurine dioxygenase
MPLNIELLSPNLGAKVHIDPEEAIRNGMPGELLEALERYNVLLFPQIHMDDDTFLTLTRAMGEKHEVKVTDDGSAPSNKGIFRIASGKDDKSQREFILGNDFWHIDGMNYDVPVKATLLKCERAPSEGGDTGFANLHAAWEALPEERKRQIESLRVGHCISAALRKLYDAPTPEDFARWDAIFSRVEHPLVWRQKSGKATMLIGSTANDISGMTETEGRALLNELLDWATQDRFTYRHKWSDGDLVIFHNFGLLHKSYPYPDSAGRLMHRTTLKGTESTGAQVPEPAGSLY